MFGAKVILLSHLGRVKTLEDKEKNTLKPVSIRLSELLGKEVKFVSNTRGEELETTIEGDDDDDDDDMELLVVKIDGDWYAMSGNSFYAHYIALSADAIDFDDLY